MRWDTTCARRGQASDCPLIECGFHILSRRARAVMDDGEDDVCARRMCAYVRTPSRRSLRRGPPCAHARASARTRTRPFISARQTGHRRRGGCYRPKVALAARPQRHAARLRRRPGSTLTYHTLMSDCQGRRVPLADRPNDASLVQSANRREDCRKWVHVFAENGPDVGRHRREAQFFISNYFCNRLGPLFWRFSWERVPLARMIKTIDTGNSVFQPFLLPLPRMIFHKSFRLQIFVIKASVYNMLLWYSIVIIITRAIIGSHIMRYLTI